MDLIDLRSIQKAAEDVQSRLNHLCRLVDSGDSALRQEAVDRYNSGVREDAIKAINAICGYLPDGPPDLFVVREYQTSRDVKCDVLALTPVEAESHEDAEWLLAMRGLFEQLCCHLPPISGKS